VISKPPKISPLALGFVKSARDSCCLPLVFVCVLCSVRTGFCAPVFSASDALVLVSALKYFSPPGVRSAPARTHISLLRSARSPQLRLFFLSTPAGFPSVRVSRVWGSRSYRHSALLTGFRCLAVGSHPVVGIVFLGLIQGASFGLTGGCELCAPACASFVFFLVIFYELKLALWRQSLAGGLSVLFLSCRIKKLEVSWFKSFSCGDFPNTLTRCSMK
jgi:hypothetical protein